MTVTRRPRPITYVSIAAVLMALIQPAVIGAAMRAEPAPRETSIALSPAVTAQLLRARAAEFRKSRIETVRRVGSNLEIAARIMSARTAAERSAAVKELPVKIVRTSLPNGNVKREVYVRGALTKTTEVTSNAAVLPEYPVADTPSGPSFFSECYQEEPEPCLTEQEEVEWELELEAAEADVIALEAENAANESHMQTVCQNEPWHPSCSDSLAPNDAGPAPACIEELGEAVEDVTVAAVGVLGYKAIQANSKAAIKKLGKYAVVSARVLMWGSVIGAAIGVGVLGYCVYDYFWADDAVGPSSAETVLSMLKEDRFRPMPTR